MQATPSPETGRSTPGILQAPRSSRAWLAALPLALLLGGVAPGNVAAQETLVDRVLAIVGDSVVLLSDIIQEERQMAQGGQLPAEGTPQRDSIRRQILDQIVEMQLILQAAAEDTLLTVDEGRVEESVNQAMAEVLNRFPSQAELERALAVEGLSIQSLREMRRKFYAQQQLIALYVQANAGQGAVEVTEEEVRELFEAGRANFGERPATVAFKQIVMRAVPSDSARTAALSLAEDLMGRARAGEDFAELASNYSQDPGSAAAGGDLGWFRRGQMADAFEDAAFALPEGAISDVVESEFGFHIIQVERGRAQERKARHILIRPVTDFAAITRARELAEEVAGLARSEDFQALIDRYDNSEVADSFTIALREVPEYFPASYVAALSQREPGETVGPIEFVDQIGQEHFAVLRILEVREAGDYTFEDVRDGLRARLIEQKRVEALVEGLRAKTYIEIKGS